MSGGQAAYHGPMTWVIVGGAGYIGAHVIRALQAAGLPVAVIDDLSTGRADVIPDDVPFAKGTVLDTDFVASTLRDLGATGVIHLAAKKAPVESTERPLWYYRENVGGMNSLLEAMQASGTEQIVLSSSCSVYGTPADGLVSETAPYNPESPYGQTKVVSEWLVTAAGRAHGLNYVNLRYFNVAGTAAPELSDRGSLNLIPMVFRALEQGEQPQVFGVDYPTPDGSCVRDYVHVADLADAHATAALELQKRPMQTVYNVGRGTGHSVLEVLRTIREVTGNQAEPRVSPRRPGDPARVVGDVSKIARELGWTGTRDLTSMVSSAWAARTAGADSGS
jgi:UDP-glucose 4-epimerase